MPKLPTPHNAAVEGQIAELVLMPGDPLRAQHIAENYLQDVERFSAVRNMFGFTGSYQGHRVSVMGSGMGMPSMGIYSYELFNLYGVESIVRIGSAGGIGEGLKLHDLVVAQGACTDSNYASQFGLPGTFAPIADFGLLTRAVSAAERLGVPVRVGNVLSSDVFYNADESAAQRWASMGVLALEMESAALYMNAARAHKKALALLSISDLVFTGEEISAEDRQTSFTQMMEVALSLALDEG
ncbi:purine-nucleoside phosphorylase [Olsenella urininfantis]|uniref:purine-nucleoside phosphorylase n=1 Tax=Olsenella urininfantis TaxID=1871033 RepID=UPI00098676FB|nr:purine-nucleoside phosphorylase [Olsenella urininfantis]